MPIAEELAVKPHHAPVLVILNRNQVKNWKTPIHIGLYEGKERIKSIEINFLGPEVYE
jgi:hypothetical protein